MIHIGMGDSEKVGAVAAYCQAHDLSRVVVLSPSKFRINTGSLSVHAEHVEWSEIIMYRTYYRLLQEIDGRTLVVVSECLRTQNRHDLTYNCIRNFLNQTPHQLIFQRFPVIDTIDDFMVLFDWDTRSRWKRERFDVGMVRRESRVSVHGDDVVLRERAVSADDRTRAEYQKRKAELVSGIGLRDPHTIPRNLYLVADKARRSAVADGERAVDRSSKGGAAKFKADAYERAPHVVVGLPHNFIDFSDFLSLSGQRDVDVVVSDLKVDRWYMDRYQAWARRMNDARAVLRG